MTHVPLAALGCALQCASVLTLDPINVRSVCFAKSPSGGNVTSLIEVFLGTGFHSGPFYTLGLEIVDIRQTWFNCTTGDAAI